MPPHDDTACIGIDPQPALGQPWAKRHDPFPLFLACCQAWAAAQMWLWPAEFIGACPPRDLIGHLPGEAHLWAMFCGIAAGLILLGLPIQQTRPANGLGTTLMVAGLFISVLFWTIVATTLAINAPHSITPLVFVGLALGAAWHLAGWQPRRRRS